ncbi:MAG: FGGY family carbohydrate kinase [Paracoccaceae bacterium]
MKTLAIDQGTTSTRALIVRPDGRADVIHSVPHQQFYPAPGRVEHDAEELIANVLACLDAANGIEGVGAVGLSNQGESCLAWDGETGQPLGPVIVWQDDRTADDLKPLRSQADLVMERAGLPLDSYFSASKLGWILRNTPKASELAAKGRLRMGTTDAFFRDRLTGRFETDATTASRTSLMNLETCTWDPDLCALFGVPVAVLPSIRPTTGDLGTLEGPGLQLRASIVDQQAALYGHGCKVAGDAKITFGTGAFALSVTGPDLIRSEGGPLPTVAWQKATEPATYALDGGVYAASSAINWAKGLGLFGQFSDINAFERENTIAQGLAFVPSLAGLACPHWNRNARGAWMGLNLDTDKADMMQAILEGIAFRMAEVVAAMNQLQPVNGTISIDGGLSANPYFCQFLSDVLARDIVVSDEAELTGKGVAMLAAEAAGTHISSHMNGTRVKPRELDPIWIDRFSAARDAVQHFGAR